MGLRPNTPMTDIRIDKVFIGSCTNSRIEDLRAAAAVVRGRRLASNIKLAMVVPGSGLVKAQAEHEGLDRIFKDAGFEWREPGCSMCLGMNADRLEPGERCASTSNRNFARRRLSPDFVLNQPRYKGASILLARRNFGCGSSREHAAWALAEYGFRALIAPSYADIFFSNCCKNGLLPVALSESEVDRLFHEVAAFPGFRLTVDLEKQTVATPDGGKVAHFDIDPFRKYSLLNGLDDIGLTLRHADKIRAFEERRRSEHPWLFA